MGDYDLANEFNTHRPQKRLTKEQQIYGMWSRDSDGEEEGNEHNNVRIPGLPPTRVLRGGLNFVSGGVVQHGKKDEAEKEKKEGDEDEGSEPELGGRPMFGAVGDSSDE